ncbi:glycosyltransferase family 4 protein, partial [bacterium]|nr:glycosyltransferase family 4 protein [bacterium]
MEESNKKIKLLICTQKVDRGDAILGFFHGWILEFAKYCDKLTIICLEKGSSSGMRSNFSERKIIPQDKYDLPENVRVLSLGKEKKVGRFRYILRFFKYIWKYRNDYNSVLVHMNKEYVLLGGVFWKIFNKKIALWYNHIYGDLGARIAGFLSNNIFFTSKFSFFSKWKKSEIMPAGIDTKIFKKDTKIEKTKRSILSLGRISPVKNLHILLQALNQLDEDGIDFVLSIAGSFESTDKKYFDEISDLSKKLVSKNKIKFLGEISNYGTPKIYNQNEIFINLTNSGSMDKTILEAMSCESLVLLSNESFKGQISNFLFFKEKDIENLKKKLIDLLNLQDIERNKINAELREYVIQNHSLSSLINKIMK